MEKCKERNVIILRMNKATGFFVCYKSKFTNFFNEFLGNLDMFSLTCSKDKQAETHLKNEKASLTRLIKDKLRPYVDSKSYDLLTKLVNKDFARPEARVKFHKERYPPQTYN